jgi:hypothetical protein
VEKHEPLSGFGGVLGQGELMLLVVPCINIGDVELNFANGGFEGHSLRL